MVISGLAHLDVLVYVGMAAAVGALVLNLLYWRCPRCGRHLGHANGGRSCPHCGQPLDL